jgi:hypothetical protein
LLHQGTFLCLQEVRDFLTHGRIDVCGKTFESLTYYYVGLTKGIQMGHQANIDTKDVSRLIASPGVATNNALLNLLSASACDAVNWGLCDLVAKLTDPSTEVGTHLLTAKCSCFC